MIPRRRFAGAGVLALALVVLLPSGTHGVRADPPRRFALVVVVGAKSSLTSISSRTLATLYLARHIDDLVALNRPPRTAERVGFDARILGMSAAEVGRYWVDQEVRGERSAPRAIAEASTLGKLVAKFPTALGYLRADQVPKGLVVLRIDGKLPADRGYPLWIEVAP